VENESDDGYGALLPAGHGDWLHVGKVLALKPPDTRIWAVASCDGSQRKKAGSAR
jgi:hypothetical protein